MKKVTLEYIFFQRSDGTSQRLGPLKKYILQMKKVTLPLIILTAMVLTFGGCSKKTDTYQTEPLTDYYIKLEPGKYIRYLLDSTLYIEFGQKDTVISYEAKD